MNNERELVRDIVSLDKLLCGICHSALEPPDAGLVGSAVYTAHGEGSGFDTEISLACTNCSALYIVGNIKDEKDFAKNFYTVKRDAGEIIGWNDLDKLSCKICHSSLEKPGKDFDEYLGLQEFLTYCSVADVAYWINVEGEFDITVFYLCTGCSAVYVHGEIKDPNAKCEINIISDWKLKDLYS
ncbi:hypothetical protein P9B03_02315 [Metasolibacillus meyeri]|uniref:Uncharacterized protein n=1 Tax=Metasolibacillus meyeri TaxID=1071052 RepID=A0AAW9NMU3_9BACL|nr:hypothetical protein [Metasolibacillus meyeri]MEC1177305.1 hypothetical protein [Metasolibacillus meyeri]